MQPKNCAGSWVQNTIVQNTLTILNTEDVRQSFRLTCLYDKTYTSVSNEKNNPVDALLSHPEPVWLFVHSPIHRSFVRSTKTPGSGYRPLEKRHVHLRATVSHSQPGRAPSPRLTPATGHWGHPPRGHPRPPPHPSRRSPPWGIATHALR